MSSIQWKSDIAAYQTNDLRAFEFISKEERNKAIDLLWKDPDFAGMPYDCADGLTMIAPKEASDLFDGKRVHSKVSKLLDQEELSASELAEIRSRKQ